MPLDQKCLQPSAVSTKVLKDKGGGPSEMRIENRNIPLSGLEVYEVDGCLITVGSRCDFLVLPNTQAAVFVELKGSDVPKGLDQLHATIPVIAPSITGRSRYAVLVATRCPLSQSDVAIAQTKMKKQFNCVLRVKNMVYSCKTTDFV